MYIFQNRYQTPASPVPSVMIKKRGAAKYMRLLEGPPPEDGDGEEEQQEEQIGMQQIVLDNTFMSDCYSYGTGACHQKYVTWQPVLACDSE